MRKHQLSKILIMFRMISLIVMPMLEDCVRNASKIITQAVKDALWGAYKTLVSSNQNMLPGPPW